VAFTLICNQTSDFNVCRHVFGKYRGLPWFSGTILGSSGNSSAFALVEPWHVPSLMIEPSSLPSPVLLAPTVAWEYYNLGVKKANGLGIKKGKIDEELGDAPQ
jgi:hypothetical protein